MKIWNITLKKEIDKIDKQEFYLQDLVKKIVLKNLMI